MPIAAGAAPRASAIASRAAALDGAPKISTASCSTQPGLREVLRDLAIAAAAHASVGVR